jgi:hypothetical protein
MAGFDWGKFNRTIKKKFGGKKKQAAAKKAASGKRSDAWRAYVQRGKKK